jgi:hypothetical protein
VLSSAGTNNKQTAPHSRRPPKLRLGLLARVDWRLAGSIALLATALLLVLGALVYPRVWILSGVQSLGIDLGGLTRGQAMTALQESWQTRAILVSDGLSTWTLHPAELGVALDVEATTQAAFERGRLLEALDTRLRGKRGVDRLRDVSPVLSLDVTAAKSTLLALRPDIDVAPVNTSLRRVRGGVEASEPRSGRSLGLVETLAVLQREPLAVVQAGRLDLIVHPISPLAFDVSSVVARANEWLARTVSIVAYDPIADESLTWTVNGEKWGAWVSLDVDPVDPTQIDWAFDGRAAAAALGT